MGMFENLSKLDVTGDPETFEPGLALWCAGVATGLDNAHPLKDRAQVGAGIALGFEYGVAYAREFGIPDHCKDLVTLVPDD